MITELAHAVFFKDSIFFSLIIIYKWHCCCSIRNSRKRDISSSSYRAPPAVNWVKVSIYIQHDIVQIIIIFITDRKIMSQLAGIRYINTSLYKVFSVIFSIRMSFLRNLLYSSTPSKIDDFNSS